MVIADRALVRSGASLTVADQQQRLHPDRGVLLEVLRAGVCGTDLQICRQVRPDGARILGHEGLARVIAGAPRRCVVFNPVNPNAQDQILGHSYDGIFRERYLTEACDVPALFTVASDLSADLAVLIEPLAAVLYGWELVCGGRPPDSVSVWGAGATAVMMALVAESSGCEVHLVHGRPERLRFLEGLELFSRCQLHLDARDCRMEVAASFLCLPREGAPAALSQALRTTRDGGLIDLVGGFASGDRHLDTGALDLGQVRRANVCGQPMTEEQRFACACADGRTVWLTGHRGTSSAHLAAAEKLLLTNHRRFARLVTHVLSLELAATVLPALARRERLPFGEYLKVLIDPTLRGAISRQPEFQTTSGDLLEAA